MDVHPEAVAFGEAEDGVQLVGVGVESRGVDAADEFDQALVGRSLQERVGPGCLAQAVLESTSSAPAGDGCGSAARGRRRWSVRSAAPVRTC
ncbi:hypothetical protein GZL_08692 [Streptomyces sp. 769]|nr:hypothetical protein GZL_08692 [Streptomyces sp. 769]